ncbi:MAG: N-acetyltransferase [Hyphomicrobiales bacterium]|nr:N-acetyltransferase [Hyphomicrobiales bacterium]
MTAAQVRVLSSLSEIDRDRWDAIANPRRFATVDAAQADLPPYDPFLSHDFLWSLEESGSAIAETGWLAQHLVLESDKGEPIGLMPCYLKGHSFGEYVFDHGWAEAYEQAGGSYYPKLLAAVPFTPVPGRRLIVMPGPEVDLHRRMLGSALCKLTERHGLSSAHVNFLGADESALLGEQQFLQRTGQQFHWENADYPDFEAFLGALASRKRKAIRRERRDALADGLTIERVTGADITEAHWDDFFAFYMDTGSRKWGQPYLNRRFFSAIGERLADDLLLVFALRDGRRIAGALNFIGSDALYGRYWGCAEHHPFLHFELCYYQAIDYAIEAGLSRVEAGAQGDHKIARGYLPTITHSAHYIADPGFRQAVADFLARERRHVDVEARVLGEYAPYRRDASLTRAQTPET